MRSAARLRSRGTGPLLAALAAAAFLILPMLPGPLAARELEGDHVVFLEAISLVEEPDGLFLYARHFDPQLVPMEEEAIRLRLVERRGNAFHFENIHEGQNLRTSVLRRTEDGIVSSARLVGPEGEPSEIRVEYERVGGR